MMRMVIGSFDYLQSLRIVARASMSRASEANAEGGRRKEKNLSPVPFSRVSMGVPR